MFSFEALQARYGDALLVHYGPEDDPEMIIIDGGPSNVFDISLKPRLEQIAFFRDLRPLPARLTMVSHIDDDHIVGIRKLVEHVRDDQDPIVEFESFWHNSFDDEIGNTQLAMLAALGADEAVAGSLGIGHFIRSIMAGVVNGKKLRDLVAQEGIVTNAGGARPGFISEGDAFNIGHGTSVRVLNPDHGELVGLQLKFDDLADHLSDLTDQQKQDILADIAEKSLANISSIVVLIEKSGATMLLTGDARGDNVISGLRRANLLPNGKAHVNILKLPHHGSDKNVDTDFFRTVSADHYVFSGDRTPSKGTNPDRSTFQMVTEVRGDDEYAMHFTYEDDAITEWIAEDRQLHPNRNYAAFFPGDEDFGIWIDLDDEALWF